MGTPALGRGGALQRRRASVVGDGALGCVFGAGSLALELAVRDRTGPYGSPALEARPHGDGLGGPPPLSLAAPSMRSPTSLRRPGWPPDGPRIVASGRSCQSGNYCWPPRIVASARTEATCNTSQNSQAGLPTPKTTTKNWESCFFDFEVFPGISGI